VNPIDISIIIISYNTKEILRECLQITLKEIKSLNCEVIVVDNNSKDNSADMVASEFPQVRLIRSGRNLGFGGANNLGFLQTSGKYIVFLNSDAFLKPDVLLKAFQKMEEDPEIGLAGAKLVGQDGSWQPSARQFPSLLNDFLQFSGLAARFSQSRFFGKGDRTWASPLEATKTDWVPGAFAIARRDLLKQLNCFDERFFLYSEEVDLCKRIKKLGYQIWYWPDLVVIHLGGESAKKVANQSFSTTGSQLTLWSMRSLLLYYRKHHGFLRTYFRMVLEIWWHKLRIIKNYWFADPVHKAKVAESSALILLLRQAWHETQGGQESPPRPW